MKTYRIEDKVFSEVLDAETIREAIRREAARIAVEYADRNPVFIVVLKGAMFFAIDLIREAGIPCSMEVLSAKSYGNAMQSSGEVSLSQVATHVGDRHVIVIEDIVDTGNTLQKILAVLAEHKPASLRVATLLSKPSMHKVKLDLHYCCFEIGPEFLIGYGLDFAEQGRELQSIYALNAALSAEQVG